VLQYKAIAQNIIAYGSITVSLSSQVFEQSSLSPCSSAGTGDEPSSQSAMLAEFTVCSRLESASQRFAGGAQFASQPSPPLSLQSLDSALEQQTNDTGWASGIVRCFQTTSSVRPTCPRVKPANQIAAPLLLTPCILLSKLARGARTPLVS
jgi:hypothetical protein